ncbi:MAG: MBL fold metallo-hydrolase [Myxococcota bacterium]|nr:MBL fold metallo-hydrolase [Myxococcota bacterium]
MMIRRPPLRWILSSLLLLALGITGCLWSVGDVTGARAEGDRLKRMAASPQWDPDDERFTNELERIDGNWIEMTSKFFFGGSRYREPGEPLQVQTRERSDFDNPPASGLRLTWMGHSAFLVEIDGVRTLIDPIWSERASPFTWAGPKRFYAPPLAFDDLPHIDAIIISHDHYDHLDRPTVARLIERYPDLEWLVPLGVGAHLEFWDVEPEKIIELDWWDDHRIGDVKITATPSRHFSGRAVTFMDQNATLWAGWAWKGPTRSLFYSGDTALHPQFAEIGARLGPFDVTLMESGAYNQLWADVHLGPEQAVIAHRMVGGNVMIPVHWGLFDLALHGWTEPAERVAAAAERLGVDVAILRPGASYEADQEPRVDRWWPETPWEPVEEAPAWSSSVEELQLSLRKRASK